MGTLVCKNCGIEFEEDTTSKYKRKYCNKCSKQMKKEFKLRYLIKVEDCEDE